MMLQTPNWTLGLKSEMLDRGELPAIIPDWQDLCGRSLEDNVYYTPPFAKALLDTTAASAKVRFAVVRDETRLVGLLPVTRPAVPAPLLRAAGQAWQTDYTFSCTPLLDKERATEAAQVLLRMLAAESRGAWRLPALNVDGPSCRAMIAALEREGFTWSLSRRFERAALSTGLTFEEHMQRHVDKKRRKDLERNRRRLEKLAPVRHEVHRSGEGLDRAVRAVLSIEAAGWKGRRGTALACRAETRRFAETAFTGDEANSICRADVLSLDGKPIAVSLMTFAGRTGFTVKCCFDEAYRTYSAGLLLEVEVIRSFLSEGWADRLDSATAGAHVVDDLWPERISVADLIFSAHPRSSGLRVSALRRTDEMRRSGKARIKEAIQAATGVGRVASLLRSVRPARTGSAKTETSN
jgi:CelD/BcsL family acetyltransferase involved in cellulose biosynthesis